MGLKRVIVRDDGVETPGRAGVGMCEHNLVSTNASAGAQTITAAMMMGGVALFTGAAGAVNYTTDTAVNILAALDDLDIGDTYTFRLCNTAAQTATIVAGTGVTLAGFTTLNAATRTCIIEKLTSTAVKITSI